MCFSWASQIILVFQFILKKGKNPKSHETSGFLYSITRLFNRFHKNFIVTMKENNFPEEQNLTSSDTDSEVSESSEDESTTATMTEADNIAPITQPELPLVSFLKRVFEEAGSLADDDDSGILRVAVHAVMLQSGFVCFVPESKKKIDGSQLPNPTQVNYTLPEAFDFSNFTKIETVVLKFEDSGDLFHIEGSLSEKEPVVHQLSLNPTRFVPPLDLAFVNSDMIDSRIRMCGSSSNQYPENEVFELHRLVSDALVYPLLIDLRLKLGLIPPPCFMRLPAELKLKILELLIGVDIARAASVCSELRNLAKDDELWRRKCKEEFGFRGSFRRESWKIMYMIWHMRRRNRPAGRRSPVF